jgi:tetratricopeptide (TPR) repeat protein
MKKWVRRHPLAAALAGGLLTAMLASAFFAYQAKHDRDQLRTQERQAAVDNAILESLSGDFEAALKAIADAEERGAEPGLLSMLRGMIEIHRGQPKQALDYLYKADRELPGSVAVRALLVKALAEDGQFQSADAMTMGLEKSRPQTPEDHLFLGLLQPGFDPATALRTLDGMPARARQLPVARLARAKVQTSLAQSTGRAEDGERAREELRHVDLPENHPLLLSARMTANLTMAQAYHQDEPRREAILKESARDLEQFAVPGNNLLALSRLSYYQVLGDDDRFLEALAEAKQDGVELPILVDLEALVYYRRGDFDKALSIMRAGRAEGYEPYRKYHEGVVLATMPGRTAEAEEALMNAIQTCQGGIAPALLPAYLQLLGPEYAQKSQQRALETQQQSEARISSIRNGWYHEVLKYNAGILGEGQLLKRAGENHWNLCEAHFFIGLRHLVEGKRGEAKASFQRSVDTGIYFYYEYNWSRAFLTQIDNPNWLPWCRVN